MLLVLQNKDGRWCAPSIESGDGFEDGYGERWAEAVCATLGLPAGSLVPFVVEDDADPRTGDLLSEPVPDPVVPPAPQPSPFEQLVTALAAEPALSQDTKTAIMAITGGADAVLAVPLVPRKA